VTVYALLTIIVKEVNIQCAGGEVGVVAVLQPQNQIC